MPEPLHTRAGEDRRGFLKKFCASVISAMLGLVPAGAGLMVLLDPLRRKASAHDLVQVATLDSLPDDGIPRQFRVLASHTDAWNKFTHVPIGAVYLRRTSDGKLQAFNAVCPHLGCFVDFKSASGKFLCPCHNSSFTAGGKIDDPSSPSPRDLDSLEVEVRADRTVWVKFQNFQASTAQNIPVA